MAKFVKVILFLLLTVTLHGVASNVFTEKPVEQSELAITYSMKQGIYCNAAPTVKTLCHSIGGEFIILQLLITVSHRVSTMYLL